MQLSPSVFTTFAHLAVIGTAIWSSLGHASDRTAETGRPSEIMDRQCAEVPEVTVCVMNQAGKNLPQLQIIYRGYLTAPEYAETVAWVNLNGKSGFFQMRSQTEDANGSKGPTQLWLGAPKAEYQCIIMDSEGRDPAIRSNSNPTPGSETREWPACPAGTPGEPGDLRWIVEPPADEEASLFEGLHPAEGPTPDWSLELAFVSVDGRRWDSKYGSNYRFTFPSRAQKE